MLFDLGMSELLLIGVVALVVIGPKDLPKALRVAGYWVRKARTLSREFQSSVEQMMREAELDDMRRELKKATEIDLEKEFRQTIDPSGSLAESLTPPELPKFFDAEPATGPRSEAAAEEATKLEASAPAAPVAPSSVETGHEIEPPGGNSSQGEVSSQDFTVAPAEAGVQGDGPSRAAPGFPLARE